MRRTTSFRLLETLVFKGLTRGCYTILYVHYTVTCAGFWVLHGFV